jgi:hypothetical protein
LRKETGHLLLLKLLLKINWVHREALGSHHLLLLA